MNKRLNKILNIIEIALVVTIAFSMIILSKISLSGLNSDLFVIRKVLLFTSIIAEIIIIGIELMLFIVYKKNIKYLYIAYIIGELSLAVLINIYIPFSGLFIVGIFSIAKAIIRLKQIARIYNKKYFNRYCKLFNIKLSTVSTRKVTKKKTAKRRTPSTRSKTIKSYA